jgi:hypothetical protein
MVEHAAAVRARRRGRDAPRPARCGGVAGWRMGMRKPEEKEQTGVCESVGPFGSCRGPPTAVSDGFKLDRTP